MKIQILHACAALLLTASAVSVQAQEVSIRVADSFPVGHYAVEEGLKPFMDAVKERTDGAVDFQYFPAGQLGKAEDMMQLLQSGVADITYIQPSYLSDKLPLSSIVGLPGLVKQSCASSRAYMEVGGEEGLLGKEEFRPNGMRLLLAIVTRPYQLQTKTELKSIGDLSGMKVRSGGGTQEVAVTELGAVPVRVSGPEMYEALSRGTADAVILPLASVLSYDLQGLVKFSTETASFGSTAMTYFISDALWDKLSPEQQTIVMEEGMKASMAGCEFVDNQFEEVAAQLTDAGMTIQDLPEAEDAKLADILNKVTQEWTEEMKERGKPAAELLDAYNAAGGAE